MKNKQREFKSMEVYTPDRYNKAEDGLCNHPVDMMVDLGDDDRGQDLYCGKCERKI